MRFPGGAAVKNMPTSAGNRRVMGVIPGLRRSPGLGVATHGSILAWKTPWTEEPGGLQFMGPQRVEHDGVPELTHISST